LEVVTFKRAGSRGAQKQTRKSEKDRRSIKPRTKSKGTVLLRTQEIKGGTLDRNPGA